MWTRLVEIVEIKWRHSSEPPQRLAKGAAVLYGAMTNCREAFLNFKREQTDGRFLRFVFSIEALLSTLSNLHASFHIFDVEAERLLEAHTLRAAMQSLPEGPGERARIQIKLLRAMIHREFAAMDVGTEVLGEFDDGLHMLAAFIRAHYSLEEILSDEPVSTGGSEARHSTPTLRVR